MLASTGNSKSEMTIVSKDSAFYIPKREREIGNIHCFILCRRRIRYIRRRRNREREGKKEEEKREREIGENHYFIVFSLFCSSYTSKGEGEGEGGCVRNTTTVHIRQE